jgi:hypothetical protein
VIIEAAGFVEVEFSSRRYDTFSDAPSASSAAEFETQGVDIRAVKPNDWAFRRSIGD